MRWSWKLGRIAGIDIFVHATFFILLAWIAIAQLVAGRDGAAALDGVVFVTLVFAIIVLHELGHALTARVYGIKTRDITLLPIGGVARLERIPEKPHQELLVALAGPAVNFVLAAIFFAGTRLTLEPVQPHAPEMVGVPFLVRLFWVNVVMAVFNLIPAFPMDGGRALRAVLAMNTDYARATELAAKVGQAIALVFGVLGLFFDPFLVFIALFVWSAAASEAAMVQLRSALGGIPVGDAMIRTFQVLSPRDSLARAVGYSLAGFQVDFPVVDEGTLVGMLTREELFKALAQGGQEALVETAMHTHFETADASEMLDRAFQRLQGCPCQSFPVIENGHVVGIITKETVGELVMLQSALREAARAKSTRAIPTPSGPNRLTVERVG